MDFKQIIINGFKGAIDFNGRANRENFWIWIAFTFAIWTVCSILSSVLFILSSLILFVPTIAITIRRYHDINKSGWWSLIVLIPIIGPLLNIFFLVQKGTIGSNNYGY